MAVKLPEVEESELNMTPMIDIVFQLIIFFLLSLKFKTIDRRIESMLPKDRGLAPTPSFPEDFLKVKIKVFRRDMDDTEKAYTLVKIDNDSTTFSLPMNWKGHEKETADRVAEYDGKIAAIRSIVAGKMKAHGGNPEEVKGEIVAPPPKGGAVPHGDVVQVLNIFLELGMLDVVFEGAASPLTTTERNARSAGG
ncbi:MAG: biopolymer transporter ExbD [Planctomycetota bacterium]|nr:biopolymer transporter ExbD [Planctomycetota bacterium]